jgi:hypothetical protein
MRLDDRVAFKVASRAVGNFANESVLEGPVLSWSKLLGRHLRSMSPCLRGARKVADKVALFARDKTILAQSVIIPRSFVGVQIFRLLKTSPYLAREREGLLDSFGAARVRELVADSEGLSLIRIMHSTFLGVMPKAERIRKCQLMGYITRHAIERYFKRTGTTSIASFEREIREGIDGFILMDAMALTHQNLKQAWAITKSGLFIGFAERDQDGYCWVTYTTFIEKSSLSGRWLAAHRLAQRFMGSVTHESCKMDGGGICHEALSQLMAFNADVKAGDLSDRGNGESFTNALKMLEKNPMLNAIDDFIESNYWVTHDYIEVGDAHAAAWNDPKRNGVSVGSVEACYE